MTTGRGRTGATARTDGRVGTWTGGEKAQGDTKPAEPGQPSPSTPGQASPTPAGSPAPAAAQGDTNPGAQRHQHRAGPAFSPWAWRVLVCETPGASIHPLHPPETQQGMKSTGWVKEQKFGYPGGHLEEEQGLGAALLSSSAAPSMPPSCPMRGDANPSPAPPGPWASGLRRVPPAPANAFLTSYGIGKKS